MIEAQDLAKRFGGKTAVDGITFTVQPGKVTGFLGPNGAGKSTTMRLILGLDQPSAGTVTVNGLPYARHRAPLHEVGALLEARAVHPRRTAYNHLRALAATHGIGARRIRAVIDLTGLGPVARKRVGSFSLGMGQRLGIAVALLGDPQTLIFDEPVNGLDPEGVQWVRHLARELAAEGRTVFISSHLMSEMAVTADHLIVIGRGRILADAPMEEVIAGAGRQRTLVRADDAGELADALAAAVPGAEVRRTAEDQLEVFDVPVRSIAEAALARRILVTELTPQQVSLEDAYMELTRGEVEYQSLSGPLSHP
ncbi:MULTISPECIES: ABC transporter ATP-binding protein [unclassified Arthrobacter]|uniref:ABC transporter ATP-binding protein n=1 Tax=unclassified Arthrobacter TaxID=235627 RepID=UPI001D15B83E|nr:MULTISPECIES: ATP-binding cassette domain-containing protein [unclassified Arthrobacter]MCC3275584.1 ATP-binding cassette domain-containing protein [Arthrobacter sp. zg-Y20]MCC3278657.1 ATP-binding cassette domain-containing protein [Arthrobacter sp. zg-Y40]MCC9177024.1 ATP-binding cassette domain-containing protein [Arthrobacter sp. zg-Y750]MDK1315741.1 ATP-binding cassette domain-containing protein [Arthrobacter sp. zg.Y20]MDK1326265.1 ATP-binding cassette domain-containing protein [Arthr